jgi:hypothetical protein
MTQINLVQFSPYSLINTVCQKPRKQLIETEKHANTKKNNKGYTQETNNKHNAQGLLMLYT